MKEKLLEILRNLRSSAEKMSDQTTAFERQVNKLICTVHKGETQYLDSHIWSTNQLLKDLEILYNKKVLQEIESLKKEIGN